MSKAKRWPNNAEHARTNSLAQARRGQANLRPVLEDYERMTTVELVRRVATALDALNIIYGLLIEVGSQAEKDREQ